jgi:hypothetical protein
MKDPTGQSNRRPRSVPRYRQARLLSPVDETGSRTSTHQAPPLRTKTSITNSDLKLHKSSVGWSQLIKVATPKTWTSKKCIWGHSPSLPLSVPHFKSLEEFTSQTCTPKKKLMDTKKVLKVTHFLPFGVK